MTTTLNPYLLFEDTARQALEFYAATFGGSARISTFGDFGTQMAGPEYAHKVMHGEVDIPGGTVVAEDLPPGEELRPGNNVSLMLGGPDAEQLRRYWAALSEGGAVLIPLAPQMWGDEYGRCVDRFGITWHVNIAADPAGIIPSVIQG